MNKNRAFREGNIVTLRSLYGTGREKNFYIGRIVNYKDYSVHAPGVYLEDFWNPNNDHDYTNNVITKDYETGTVYRMSMIEGVEITTNWLIDNDFATMNIWNNEEHERLHGLIVKYFAHDLWPWTEDVLIYYNSFKNEYNETVEVVILFNRKNHETHILSFMENGCFDKDALDYIYNYVPLKTFYGKLYEIHELQNILMDMGINILDSLLK